MKNPVKNNWRVPADTTVQVVDPFGITVNLERKKNWPAIIISLALIAFVLAMIVAATFILGYLNEGIMVGRPMTYNDLDDLLPKPMFFQWTEENFLAFFSEQGNIEVMDTRTNVQNILVDKIILPNKVERFLISPNGKKILLVHSIQKESLFGETALYTVYDVDSRQISPLKINHTTRLQHAEWAFGGRYIVILHNNNVYYQKMTSLEIVQLTNGTLHVFNGVPDFFYEGILRTRKCLWTSPDGRFTIIVSFNDGNLRERFYFEFSSTTPSIKEFWYPDGDNDIPEISLSLIDWQENVPRARIQLNPPVEVTRLFYLLALGWNEDNLNIWNVFLNGDRSELIMSECHFPRWKCRTVYRSHLHDDSAPMALNGILVNHKWLIPWNIQTSSAGYWHNQIAEITRNEGIKIHKSLPDFFVKRIVASCPIRDIIFFTAEDLKTRLNGQLYSVASSSSVPKCYSCFLNCSSLTFLFNKNLTNVAVQCHDALQSFSALLPLVDSEVRFTYLHLQPKIRKLSQEIAKQQLMKLVLKINRKAQALATLSLPAEYETQESGTLSLIIQIQPENNDDSAQINQFASKLSYFLTSGQEVAHTAISVLGNDPSSPISSAECVEVYRKAIRILVRKFKVIDGDNIVIYGWGNSATLALNLATADASLIKGVAAIHPVINTTSYSSFPYGLYGSPSFLNDPLQLEKWSYALNSTKLLLVQGTRHPLALQSFYLAKMLTQKGHNFRHIVYADEGYFLENVSTNLIRRIDEFLQEVLEKC